MSHLTFVNVPDVVYFLQRDPDHYYETFTRFDLYARRVASVADYIDRIKKAIVPALADLQRRIRQAVTLVDNHLIHIRQVGFNGQKASSLPWRIGFMRGKGYEDGLPHTRVDLIMLPISISDDELVDTLLHEKIHIYQKAYPLDVALYLANGSFERVRPRTKRCRVRANPDTDEWIYRDSHRVYKCLYSSTTPRHIEDVDVDQMEFEHPFETMCGGVPSPHDGVIPIHLSRYKM